MLCALLLIGSTPAPQLAITPLRTLAPTDTDYSDLQPLRNAVGDARVVMLGEQTHGDGAAFLLKTRVVMFLHAEMGFDVLVFESGLYDCDHAQPPASCLLYVWQTSHQMQHLTRTLDAGTLELAGMDIQLAGTAAQHLPHELTTTMQAAGSDLLTTGRGQTFLRVLRDLAHSTTSNPPEHERALFFDVLAQVQAILRNHGGTDADYLLRVLDGAAAYAEQIWTYEDVPYGYMRRDVLMGDNLLWLVNERYAGRKVIVWTAGYHAVRNLPTARDLTGQALVVGAHTTTADVAHAALGDEMRVFNITSAAGSYYDWRQNTIMPVPSPQSGSFEARLAATGHEFAFVNLRDPGAAPWLQRPLVGTPAWNYQPMRAEWAQLFDGMFFIREMTPSTRIR